MPALAADEAWRRLAAARVAYLATVRSATWTTPFGAATVIEIDRMASWLI